MAKQQSVKRKLDFGNIKDAGDIKGNLDKSASDKSAITQIRFNVHKDQVNAFKDLRLSYAQKNKNYNFSLNNMFTLAVNFMYQQYQEDGILEEFPEGFKESMLRRGKRKATDRTFPAEQTDDLIATVTDDTADKYLSVMFSFISNNPDDDLFQSHHSRTYFFYDFINYLSKNRNKLLKYEIS